jgi:DNA-binding NarL/FixJ family response regulator
MENLDRVLAELEQIKLLLAVGATKDLQNKGEKIRFLARCGVGNRTIADIVGTTPNTVQVTISKGKSAKGAGTKRGKRRQGLEVEGSNG